MGSEVHLHAKTASGAEVILRFSTVGMKEEALESFKAEKEVYFTFSGDNLHLFDLRTGENILLYNNN
jgi:hypothetical protein